LNCTSCGASLSGFEGKNEVRCDYCNTTIMVLRPRSVNVVQGNLSSDNFDRLNNYVEILQKAIRAGNYSEGYEYCNKALEINPSIGSIWENKAICAFWRSVSFLNDDKITITNAREIKTFLNASKENDPTSETYEITSDAIGSNLATILKIKLKIISPDSTKIEKNKTIETYSSRAVNRAKDYLETMETAYDIMVNKDINILTYLVKEFSNEGKLLWWEAKAKFGNAEDPSNAVPSIIAKMAAVDVEKKRNSLIKRIKIVKPSYNPPNIKIKMIPMWILLVGIVFFALYFFVVLLKK
jgi:LSD1 subclass zinc finger protein